MEKGASGQIYYFHENFPSQIFGKAVNVPLYIRFRTNKGNRRSLSVSWGKVIYRSNIQTRWNAVLLSKLLNPNNLLKLAKS